MKICPACRFDRCDDTAETCRQCGADLTRLDELSGEHSYSTDGAWFHYLQIPRIGAVELVPGRAFRIGRGPRNELRSPKLRGDEVCEVFWTDGYDEATVRKMDAPDEVKVDGIRLKQKRTLKGGEEVDVGPFRLLYLKRGAAIPDAIDAKKVGSRAGRPDPKRGVAAPAGGGRRPAEALEPSSQRRDLGQKIATPRRRAGSGPLEPAARGKPAGKARRTSAEAAPADVLRALEKTKAVGTLLIRSPGGSGWVTVVAGKLRHAAFGGRQGRPALDAILRLPSGRCRMLSGLPTRGEGEPLGVTVPEAQARLKKAAAGRPRPRPRPRPRGWGGASRGRPRRPRPRR